MRLYYSILVEIAMCSSMVFNHIKMRFVHSVCATSQHFEMENGFFFFLQSTGEMKITEKNQQLIYLRVGNRAKYIAAGYTYSVRAMIHKCIREVL